MSKFWIGLLVIAVMGGVLFVASVVQNQGCMPWQTAVRTGGGVFSEGDRGQTHCS